MNKKDVLVKIEDELAQLIGAAVLFGITERELKEIITRRFDRINREKKPSIRK